jgi:hypothetical protein
MILYNRPLVRTEYQALVCCRETQIRLVLVSAATLGLECCVSLVWWKDDVSCDERRLFFLRVLAASVKAKNS